MGRKVTEKKRPSFFHIIHPSLTTEHLRIPPKFIRKNIANDPSKWATLKLEGSLEGSWRVKVRKSGRDVCLKEGWQEFLRENCFGDKEFLTFFYHGEMLFSVEIFRKNGCQRMDFHEIKAHQNSKVPNSNKRTRAVVEVEVEEDYNDYPAQESAELSESGVPQFTRTISGLHNVDIPKSFSRKYLSPSQYEVSLKNGNPWEVRVLENNGRLCISAGWRAFAKASQIKLRDKCTFRLVSEKRMEVDILASEFEVVNMVI